MDEIKTKIYTDEMSEIAKINLIMEEMAGQPKEDLGKREPGEKCAYEMTSL